MNFRISLASFVGCLGVLIVTRGSVVLLHGVLRGMGREAACDILARRTTIEPFPAQFANRACLYEECSVLTAPSDLPDGDYLAFFDGHSLVATRARGIWISRGAAARDSAADGLAVGRDVNLKPEQSQSACISESESDEGAPNPAPQRINRSC